MKKQRLKQMLAAAMVLCTLSGCTLTERLDSGKSGEVSEPAVTDHAAGYFGLGYYTGELVNPALSTSRLNRVLVEALYEGLFYLDDQFQAQPMLCESWKGDGVTFSFQLKEGVTFWSGAALTADDVVYSLRAASKNETSPYYERMKDVKSIYAEDALTVGVVLKSANMKFPALMDIPVFRAGTEQETFSDGTGAYRPNHEGGQWWLTPYEGWHGGALGVFSRIDLVSTARPEAAVHSFETGDISMLRAERISAAPVTLGGAVELHQTPTTVLHYLGFGSQAGPGSLPAVRQAISAAIGRDSICNTQLQTFASPAVLPMNPQPEAVQGNLRADLDAAQAALTAAGIVDTDGDGILDYDNGGGVRAAFAPKILVNQENTFKVSAAQQIADALRALGISATVELLPFEEYAARLTAGNFEIYYAETRMMPDFDLRAIVGTAGALNYGGYASQDTDWLIEKMRAEGTDEAEQALFEQLLREMPIVPVAFIRDQVAVRSKLMKGFNPSPSWLFHGVAGWRKS